MSVSVQFVQHAVQSPAEGATIATVDRDNGEVRYWPAGIGHSPCIIMDGQDFDRLVVQVNEARAK